MVFRRRHAARGALLVASLALVCAGTGLGALSAGATAATAPAAVAAAVNPIGTGVPTDSNIAFIGRWDKTDPTAYISNWPGAYFKLGFTGTTIRLRQRKSIDLYASIDGGPDVLWTNVTGILNLTPTPLKAGNHTLRVSYRVVDGSYHGDAVFQGVVLDKGAKTLPAKVSSQLVEFVGDSITRGTTSSKVALTAYGWLVGEQLHVEHTQIGYGGGCLVPTPDGCVGMINQYFKIGQSATSADWDFSRYQANVVVINLGTNDKSHNVSGPTFQTTYIRFLTQVRAKYPKAKIIALRTFSNRYYVQTQAAVASRNRAGDANVQYVNTDGWLTAAGRTDSVHPNDAGHRAIAAKLAPIVAAALKAQAGPAPKS